MISSLLLVVALALGASEIENDEQVVFYSTWAQFDAEADQWRVSVHGLIYETEQDSTKVDLGLAMFRLWLGLREGKDDLALFRKRARPFLVDHERSKTVSIRCGSQTHEMKPSGPGGHFTGQCLLPASEVKLLPLAKATQERWIGFEAVTRRDDDRHFLGRVLLLEETGLSIISDIDDTIKISEVADRDALLRNTFCKPFEAVPGMAACYQRWARDGAAFHYVTASPWQLFEPLEAFREAEGFPAGTFHMKSFRLKDSTVLNLLTPPDELKTAAMEPLLKAFPRREFILVGDSGERDPEIFAAIARKYPKQVRKILIRNTTAEKADSPRMQAAFQIWPTDRWQLFDDAKELGEE